MPKEKKTLAELITVLNNDMTLFDILSDLGWAVKERERLKVKDARKREKRREEKKALTEHEKRAVAAGQPEAPVPEPPAPSGQA